MDTLGHLDKKRFDMMKVNRFPDTLLSDTLKFELLHDYQMEK